MRLRALFAAIFCVLSVTAAHAASSADPMGWTGIMYHHSSSSLEDGHGDGYTSYTGAITLTGAVVSGADRITVTWEAEGSEYALSKFRK